MAKKSAKKNLPNLTKQTAGGIGGAVVGGLVAGPLGAVAAGVAGAMVGDASAEGKQPVKRAVAAVRSKLGGGKAVKALTAMKDNVTGALPKKATKKKAKSSAPKGGARKKKSKPSTAKKKSAAKKAAPKKKAKAKKAAGRGKKKAKRKA